MLGVDIVDLKRIEASYQSLGKKILSSLEKEQMSKLPPNQHILYVGGRFAAKEAFIKASGLKNVKFEDLSILNDEEGKPHLYYNKEEVGEVSIAHDYYCVAVVMLTRKVDSYGC